MFRHSKLSAVFLIIASTLVQAAETYPNVFDSKGNPKAKGVWFSLKYPNGWTAIDADRPNIVKKFTRTKGPIIETLGVQINNLTPEQVKAYSSLSADQWAAAKCDFYKEADVSDVKVTKQEGEKAFLCDAKVTVERTGVQVHQANQFLTVLYKDKVINLICSAVSAQTSKEDVNRALERLKPTCFGFFNNFVLLDKYSN